MKKIVLICAAVVISTATAAQSGGIAPVGIVNGEVSRPQTNLYVDITVERQEITAGPYARYAQKYLGVSAPLADKVLYEIKSAKISDNNIIQQITAQDNSGLASHMNPAKGFPKLLIDKTSNAQSSLEDNARLAADQIFKIRKSRYELITAEAGENVFGAGLASALDELDRQEEEYLSLFLGRQFNTTVVKQYKVTPAAGKQTYIVCRFSSIDGPLSADDLSGEPVVLETKALNTASTNGLNISPKPTKTAYCIADDASCRIVFNNKEIASITVPVYQFGQTVYIVP